MDFREYEKSGQFIYSEFATNVRRILDHAIRASGGPLPQAIQARAKDPVRLLPKLRERGLEASPSIETEIKDLAGARIIFYTNLDVERFLNARVIPDSFKVDWAETRIHHPTPENNSSKYQAVHYTVTLDDRRISLPEYARFLNLRCEIQIQTILIHAWSETSHDILYKKPSSPGFGGEAEKAISRRLDRVIDQYLVPAGYEMQKAQHDFERLMLGKALFDRGTLETLDACVDNNQRHEVLSEIRVNVLPNYDDLLAIHSEVLRALEDAVVAARSTSPKPIETAFGNLEGKTAADVAKVAVDILDWLRYVDVGGTFRSLLLIYNREQDGEVRKRTLSAIKNLAEFNLAIMPDLGLHPQVTLANALESLPEGDVPARAVVLTVWRELLSSEVTGTTWAADAVTLSRGAVQPDETLRGLRAKAISALLQMFDAATSVGEQREVFSALTEGTRLPYQGNYSNDLIKVVISDTTKIVEAMTARAPEIRWELLEHVEHSFLFEYRRAKQIGEQEDDRFIAGAEAEKLAQAVLSFREQVNVDLDFVRYKTLVGFESVFPFQWDDPESYHVEDEVRLAEVDIYVSAIDEKTEDKWLKFLERCAQTDSTDLATFPIFGEFVVRLAREKPSIALRMLNRASPDLLNFLPGFLNGLASSAANKEYQALIGSYVSSGEHLLSLMRHLRFSAEPPIETVVAILEKAIAVDDVAAVIEGIAVVVKHYDGGIPALIERVYIPALRFLNAKQDSRWINGAYFFKEAPAFFESLPRDAADLTIENLLNLRKIEHGGEIILAALANVNLRSIWEYFGSRLKRKTDGEPDYEAIPYQLHHLKAPLSSDAKLAMEFGLQWFRDEGSAFFQFYGGRLLQTIFATLGGDFEKELIALADGGPDEAVRFILDMLPNYHGDASIFEVVKAVINRLPEDDERMSNVEIALNSTGVVRGEYGFVEAYRSKKVQATTWLSDDRVKVRDFARGYIRRLDQMIIAEQRRADQSKEMRKRDYDEDGADDETAD